MGIFDFFSKEKKESLDKGLEKTKTSFFDQLSKAVVGKSKVDEEVLDDLEEMLVHSDVGVETTIKIIKRIEARVARDKYVSTGELDRILREEVAALLEENNSGLSGTEFVLPSDPLVSAGVGTIRMRVHERGVGETRSCGTGGDATGTFSGAASPRP